MQRPEPSGKYPKKRANELPQIDPTDHDPNTNPAIGSVGPQANLSTHVMYPTGGWHAEAWDGWPVEWKTPWMQYGFGAGMLDPGSYVNRISTVMTCVDLNSRQLATMPVYGIRDRQPIELPPWSTNPEPLIYGHWGEFVKASINSIELAGETVLYATAWRYDGYPSRFVALDPTKLQMNRRSDGSTEISVPGQEPFSDREVRHIKYQVLPGAIRGIGPLSWIGRNLVSAEALEQYGAEIATHGVWAVLKHPDNLDSTQATDLKANWMNQRAVNPSAPAVLSGGIDFDVLSINPKDMALLDLRTFDEQRIASAFGIPPIMVGLPQSAGLTYSRVYDWTDHHWKATLRPLAQMLASPLSSWLLPGRTRIEFNRDEYVRPAFGERAQAYSVMHGIEDDTGRAITAEEIRRVERIEEVVAI